MSNPTADPVAPCPFCGGPAIEGALWPKHYGCADQECGAYMANVALEKWNMRPIAACLHPWVDRKNGNRCLGCGEIVP